MQGDPRGTVGDGGRSKQTADFGEILNLIGEELERSKVNRRDCNDILIIYSERTVKGRSGQGTLGLGYMLRK